MDTKQKDRDSSRTATKKRPAQLNSSSGARQGSGSGGRTAGQDSRGKPQRPAYKRSAPQGASVYGASSGTARPRGTVQKSIEVKQEKKTSVFRNILSKGADATKSVNASREKVLRAQKKMIRHQKKKWERQHDTPAVIYTEPKPFNRTKLLIQLATVAGIVVAFVLALSVFFKVEYIMVSGAETYSTWAVRSASGINEGDNLLTFSKARASAKIRAELSYVDKVRIGIKLPDTVIIYIEELDVAYAIKDRDGIWWLITSDGRIVEQTDAASAARYTQVLGVALDGPVVNGNAVALEAMPIETGEGEETTATEETVPVTVTGAQRLSAALQILKALEANDIVGEAASIDVSSINSIELWYGQRYQVNLGDTTRMEYKIACMNDVILQMSDYQTGKLDISFTTWADQVGYTPFA